MNKLSVLLAAFAALSVLAAPSFAAPALMKACKKDLKKFGCTVKTDAEAHECLEKNEKREAKNEGFGRGCYEAHEKWEKAQGQTEKGEESHG